MRELSPIQSKQFFEESEAKYNLLIESVNDYAIFMMDREGFITTWNSGAEKIIGYTKAEILNKNFSVFYTKEDQEGNHPFYFGQHLKIISYNIHHGADKNDQQILNEVGNFKSTPADLVGLQEVDSLCRRSGNVDQMKQLPAITGMPNAFVRHFAYDGGVYRLGILFRFPVSDIQNDRITSKAVDGGKRSLALRSAKVTLLNIHEVRFATVHFALDQLTYMVQSAEIVDFLKRDMPVILTGDLNAKRENKAIKQWEN